MGLTFCMIMPDMTHLSVPYEWRCGWAWWSCLGGMNQCVIDQVYWPLSNPVCVSVYSHVHTVTRAWVLGVLSSEKSQTGKILTNNCILDLFSFQLYFFISKCFLCSTFLLKDQKNNFTFAFNHLQRNAHQSSWAHCELRKKCRTSWLVAHEPHRVSRFTNVSTCCSEVQKLG